MMSTIRGGDGARFFFRLLGVSSALAFMLLLRAAPVLGFSAERATFSIRVKGETIPYRVFALSVMPGQRLTIESAHASAGGLLVSSEQAAWRLRAGKWLWQAPEGPGLHVVEVREATSGDAIVLNVFVVVPATAVRNESLNGQRIGTYPATPFRNLAVYRQPTGFVEVTEANLGTRLSPHFTLDQFLCKQAGGFPKYLVLRERLLLKLEVLLELVNSKGYAAESFSVLSGFRTPFYNKAIGNVANSRHQWGGAADVFIDESPRDGMMDDLDKNGRVDVNDARLLYRLFEGVSGRPEHREFTGGLGVYGKTSNHGPFVHVDARGYRARWGELAPVAAVTE